MYLIRSVEETIAKKYSENRMRCPTHLSIGQEIVSSVFAEIMKKKDYAISSHRCHGHYLSKGGDLNAMIAEIYGKKTGCSKGKGGSMHLIDLKVNFMGSSAIVGNSIPIGVGLGLSSKINNTKKLSYIFFGDGAVEEGVFYESLNFAAVKDLPEIFVCENNMYSVYSSLKDRQPLKRKISTLAKSIGINSVSINTNNIIEMYKKIKVNVDKSIREERPLFIEIKTYRYIEHCGPNNDDELNYRPIKEINLWKKKDPLQKFLKSNYLNNKEINLINKKIDKKIKEAFKFAEKSKFPERSEAYRGVYAK